MIFPAVTETLVLPLDAADVAQRIGEGITKQKFNGVVNGAGFSLSACLIRPPQFSPIVLGRIESSSRGTVILVRYELMPATKALLVFVSVILVLIAIGAALAGARLYYSFFAVASIFVFRSVALTNIRLHRDPVRQNLLDILS